MPTFNFASEQDTLALVDFFLALGDA